MSSPESMSPPPESVSAAYFPVDKFGHPIEGVAPIMSGPEGRKLLEGASFSSSGAIVDAEGAPIEGAKLSTLEVGAPYIINYDVKTGDSISGEKPAEAVKADRVSSADVVDDDDPDYNGYRSDAVEEARRAARGLENDEAVVDGKQEKPVIRSIGEKLREQIQNAGDLEEKSKAIARYEDYTGLNFVEDVPKLEPAPEQETGYSVVEKVEQDNDPFKDGKSLIAEDLTDSIFRSDHRRVELPPEDIAKGKELVPYTKEGKEVAVPEAPQHNPENDSKIAEFRRQIEAVKQQVEAARNQYAELTRKERLGYAGRLLRKDSKFTRFIRKIPLVGKIADKWSAHRSKDVDAAREAYERATHDAIKLNRDYWVLTIKSTTESGSKERLQAIKFANKDVRNSVLFEDINFERLLQQKTELNNKQGNKFSSWWHRTKGLKGALAKGAILVAGGAVAGATVAGAGVLVGVPYLATHFGGMVAGATTGGLIARGAVRRRANSLTEKGGDLTVAQKEMYEAIARKSAVNDGLKNAQLSDRTHTTNLTEQSSDQTMLANRGEMLRGILTGKSGGALGALAVDRVVDILFSTPKPTPSTPKPTPKAVGHIVPKPELLGNTFDVQYGHGLTHEWVEWAQANGHDLTPQDAWRLHLDVLNKFGRTEIIDGISTYVQNGDVRITAPGPAAWSKGVPEFAQNWMKAEGLW